MWGRRRGIVGLENCQTSNMESNSLLHAVSLHYIRNYIRNITITYHYKNSDIKTSNRFPEVVIGNII